MTARYRLYWLDRNGWHASPAVRSARVLVRTWYECVAIDVSKTDAESDLVKGDALRYTTDDGLRFLACADHSPFVPTKVVAQ